MLIMGVKPGHDGALAVIEDRTPPLSLEAEKDSWQRHRDVTTMAFLQAAGQRRQAVLVWEGVTGGFSLLDERYRVTRTVPVLTRPGARYAFPKAKGFINTMSDLLEFCEIQGLNGMVVGDAWYRRRDGSDAGG